MITITEQQVRELLPMPECIRLMREAFTALGEAQAINHPRRRLVVPTGAVLHYMEGSYGAYFGTKVYATHLKHGANFFFLLFRAADAAPLALLEANALGQIRTGAATGLATDLMARPDAATVAIIGSGFQAETQLAAVRAVRNIKRTTVWSRKPEKREAFSKANGAEAVETVEAAVRDADIIVTATSSKDPVFDAAWVKPGAHVNGTGSNQANRRELPAELFARAGQIAVDSIEQARMEAGDLLLAGIGDDRLLSLAQIVTGRAPGRTRPDEITVFKSVGLAVEDVAAAAYVYERVASR